MEIPLFLAIISVTHGFSIQMLISQAKFHRFHLCCSFPCVLCYLGLKPKILCPSSLWLQQKENRSYSFIFENNDEIQVDRSVHVLKNEKILSLLVKNYCIFWNVARQHFVAEKQFKMYEKLCYPCLPSHSISRCRCRATKRNLNPLQIKAEKLQNKSKNTSAFKVSM